WPEPERANDLDSLRYDLYFYDDVFFGVESHEGKVTNIDVEGLVENPRIVWGESIEGVEIGDDSATVVQKLGHPAYWPQEGGGVTLRYLEGRLNTTNVFVTKTVGVFLVEVQKPYGGMTKEGVQIGMIRGEALRRLGKPSVTWNTPDILDAYFYRDEGFEFELQYNGDRIHQIRLLGPNE
ncbi:MAG TPA: hypothetical protein VFG50_08545, partial [Rhodothermales bacterium]|nr:hypothetical protein [Rhodothermales bacterium]